MRTRAALLGASVVMVLAGVACDHGKEYSTEPAASGSASVVSEDASHDVRDASSSEAPTAPHGHGGKGCRVIGSARGSHAKSVDGGDEPLHMNQFAPRGAWVDVDDGAQLTVKETVSGRETTFDGLARVRACVELDESWIAWGSSASTPGAGESPGQDQWIVTPAGVARYVGGVNRVTVSKDGTKTELRVAVGHALAWPAEGAVITMRANDVDGGAAPSSALDLDAGANVEEGWARVLNGRTITITAKEPGGAAAVEAAVTKCERTATATQTLSRQILDAGDNRGSIGALTQQHMVAQTVARAACSVAMIRVGMRREAGASTTAWADRLDRAVHAWRSL